MAEPIKKCSTVRRFQCDKNLEIILTLDLLHTHTHTHTEMNTDTSKEGSGKEEREEEEEGKYCIEQIINPNLTFREYLKLIY